MSRPTAPATIAAPAAPDLDPATMRAAFALSAAPMALVDDARRALEVNPAATRLLQRSREQILGRSIQDLLASGGEDVEGCWESLRTAGSRAGQIRLSMPGAVALAVRYSATANVVDGVHLIVCLGVPGDRVAPGGPPAETVLTPREREVLAALAAGETGKEIAGDLFIAPETVRRHVANARAKLHATTRAHAVVEALRRGEIEL